MPPDITPLPSPILLSKFLIGEESKQVSSWVWPKVALNLMKFLLSLSFNLHSLANFVFYSIQCFKMLDLRSGSPRIFEQHWGSEETSIHPEHTPVGECLTNVMSAYARLAEQGREAPGSTIRDEFMKRPSGRSELAYSDLDMWTERREITSKSLKVENTNETLTKKLYSRNQEMGFFLTWKSLIFVSPSSKTWFPRSQICCPKAIHHLQQPPGFFSLSSFTPYTFSIWTGGLGQAWLAPGIAHMLPSGLWSLRNVS